MKRLIKSGSLLFSVIFTAVIVFNIFLLPAAASTCRIKFSDPVGTVGDTISVKVYITESIAAADIYLKYDASYLTYSSASGGVGNLTASGGSGVIRIFDYYTSGEGVFSCNISFKTLKAGSTSVSVSSSDISDGGGDSMSVTSASSVVTIKAASTASSVSTLSSLSISPGTLSPSFSSGTTSYTAKVSNSVTKIAVTAKAKDPAASVSVSGNSGLDVGTNTITVTVKAEDGTKKVYTIKVSRAASEDTQTSESETGSETQTETEISISLSDGTTAYAEEFDETVIPAGFGKSTIKVENYQIPALVIDEDVMPLIYIRIGNDEIPALFFFDTDANKVYKTVYIGKESKILILRTLNSFDTPAGFTESEALIDGNSIPMFLPEGTITKDYYLVFASNADGEALLYIYDALDSQYISYNVAVSAAGSADIIKNLSNIEDEKKEIEQKLSDAEDKITELEEAANTNSEIQTKASRYEKKAEAYTTYVYILMVITAVMTVTVIVLAVFAVNGNKTKDRNGIKK